MRAPGSLLAKWYRIPEGIRFILIGGWNTVFGLAIFAGLYVLFGGAWHYLVLLAVANEVAILNAYICHRIAVFANGQPVTLGEISRFHGVYALSFFLGMACTVILVERWGLHPVPAQGLTLIITVALSYIFHRKFTFARP